MDGPRRQRILEATYACVARWGLSKTTVEDAAREAGLSRATVYRYFPGGRDELVDAVVSWQYLQFFGRLYEEVHGATSLEEVLERGLLFARRQLLEHEVLQKMVQTEPEVLMPKLTVESNRTIGLISGFLVPYLHEHGVPDGLEVHEAADFLARMILSYIASPGRWDLSDPEEVRRLVRVELLPGVVGKAQIVDR
ncbi:MAG TPA: TetR/AcrR family transcriptional regulator [Acidimicrobiales bacterium]|nr:TetR/AcrR family transcriptional regulator [Acidimicrobiales bacterium]